MPRRGEVRLADSQRDDIVHGLDDLEKIANARARNVAHVVGNLDAHGETDRRSGAVFEMMKSAVLLVGFEAKVRGGRLHGLNRAQFLGDEGGDAAKILGLDNDQKIVTAAHQIAGLHFLELRDAGSDAIEPAIALGRDLHFDHRGDDVSVPFFAIDDCLISEDHSFAFEARDLLPPPGQQSCRAFARYLPAE